MNELLLWLAFTAYALVWAYGFIMQHMASVILQHEINYHSTFKKK